jgi:hypothetical protein
MGIGSIGGISSRERSIIGISQLPVIYQVELLAYKYQNQNLSKLYTSLPLANNCDLNKLS